MDNFKHEEINQSFGKTSSRACVWAERWRTQMGFVLTGNRAAVGVADLSVGAFPLLAVWELSQQPC